MNQYETVFILNPVLSEDQIREAVDKYTDFLKSNGAEIINVEKWGLRKLAYLIDKKKEWLLQPTRIQSSNQYYFSFRG